MECPNCGGQLGLEDAVCPYCNTPNAMAAKHQSDMAHFRQEYQRTQADVMQKTSFMQRHGSWLIVLSVLLVALIGGIVLGYVWKFVFNSAFVAIGENLSIGFLKNSWLGTPSGAMACMIIVAVWQYAGYMMLIYVAGFMSVSKSLIEAAQIDGCTQSQATWKVIVPLMRSSFVQCIFLTITRCFMVYDVNLTLTEGGPFNSSVMAAMHVYRTAFTEHAFGTGQAEALILFIVCAIVGVTQVYIGRKGEVAA
jgi:raffinose/stachyose/melibiose transport system permease protein